MPLIGKIYRYYLEIVLLGFSEEQYNSNYVANLIRLEKLQAHNLKNISGSGFVVLNQNSIVLPLAIEKRPFAGNVYQIYKVLYEDKIIYIPLSSNKAWEQYFLPLETI